MTYLSWLFLLCLVSGLRAVPLLMSISHKIQFFEESDTSNITVITPNTVLAIGIDYHFKRGEFYFSDALGRIHRGWLRPNNIRQEPIVIAEVKLADGLAVDWINDNLYWTDVTKESIEVATLDGLYRKVLFNSTHGVEKPRAIVLDPFEGLLFWSDWGKDARVESSGLDGSSRKTIVHDVVWPNGLALDMNSKTIYILDGLMSTLKSSRYDGSSPTTISRSTEYLQQAFGLTFCANKLYFTSWRARGLYSVNLNSENAIEPVLKQPLDLKSIIERMMGVKAVHPSLQRSLSVSNPCESAGCSHRCLNGQGLTTTCICPYGFNLNADGKTCVEEGYLLVAWRKTIRRYTLEGTNEEPMIDGTKNAVSLDFHFKKNLVFWSDNEEHRIYRAPLGQLNNKTVVATTEVCDGLAVDWVHDVIYWTDKTHNTLQAAELDGDKHMVIFTNDLDEPRDIVLDPAMGLMFWTDWGTNAKIERAALDGQERKIIVNGEHVAWPNGLTIDRDQKKLYWVDGKLSTFSSSFYDGSQRQLIASLDIITQPFALSLFRNKVYWSDWKAQSLHKDDITHITGANKLASSPTILVLPNGVKVVHSSLQKNQENPCASVRCTDLCLGSAIPHKAHCMGEELPSINTDSEPVKAEVTKRIFNDSVQLTLKSSKIPSLVVVETKCVRREGCTEDKRCTGNNKVHVFSNITLFDIPGLLSASVYDVDFKSSEYTEQFQIVTEATNPPEVPKVKSVKVEGKKVIVKWDPVDTCIPGFNGYNYKLIKTEVEHEVPVEGKTNLTEVTFENLEPQVDYTVKIFTSDENSFSSISFATSVDKDEPAVCKKEELLCNDVEDCPDGSDEDINLCAGIDNVIVYRKSKSAVYLRCQVSNTTKKQLKKFVGKYSIAGAKETVPFEAQAEPCIMWHDSYCFNITSLSGNKIYNFKISAALKGGKVGNAFAVSALTKEEASGPPEDARVASYTSTSAVIEWHHPNQSNGIIRTFVINMQEEETFEEGRCCQTYPILESAVLADEPVYTFETSDLLPASTYAISITAKNKYIGESKSIDINTPPPPMSLQRNPNVLVSSLLPLSWKPNEEPSTDISTDNPQFHSLIRSYLLLLIPLSPGQQATETNPDLGPLQALLESKIGSGFKTIWHKEADDKNAFQQPIRVTGLVPHKQYQLVWVQVSQYKDAFGLDLIRSDNFLAI